MRHARFAKVDRKAALLRIAELPEHQVGEWISGRLIVSPRPTIVSRRPGCRVS